MKIKTKICNICEIQKSIDEFYKHKNSRFGVDSVCKVCRRKQNAEWRAKNPNYMKQWHKDNIDHSREYSRNWNKNNSERCKKNLKEWRKNNKDKIKLQDKKWRCKNSEKVKQGKRKYYNKKITDPMFRLNTSISNAIVKSLKKDKSGYHWENAVGYTLEDLKLHLESQFQEGMTWYNRGSVWHIDHIIPKSVFNFIEVHHPDFRRCWALENLQPLFSKDNLSKSNRLDGHFQPLLLLQEKIL